MTSRLPGRSADVARPPWAFALMLAALAGAGLAITNPSTADFQAYAAERLVDEISEEVCAEGGLPTLMRMAIQNCEELVLAQRAPLAALVAGHTRRHNLGLLSLYRSDVGGQTLLLWRVPRVRSTVVGVAGQFVLIGASIDRAATDSSTDSSTDSLQDAP
ncbi:MAG: DUF4359 domain-containing protein [Cyanobacteria bacterium M_DeepCast_100m_m1_067]|nr:DUF4359 domain-containing protein [Cyanobacteria bacterium M_DeepCast_100m_m1_067]